MRLKILCHSLLLILVCTYLDLKAAEHHSLGKIRMRTAAANGNPENARAVSTLVRLGLKTSWNEFLSSEVELDHVFSGWKSAHSNGETFNEHPVIPDVDGTEINQWLISLSNNHSTISLGRKRIELDDQLFIGSNGFWQNDQTFDNLTVTSRFFSATQFQYSLITNANRIFGNNSKSSDIINNRPRPANFLGDQKQQTHLFHINVRDWDYQELSSFYYDMDIEDVPEDSNQTFGMRYRFEKRFGALKPMLITSFAFQRRPFFQNTEWIPYYLIDANVGYRHWTLATRIEKLGSNNSQNFITPLGSHHDFQGWAGVINRHELGIIDRSIRLLWRRSPFKVDLRYHWFDTDEGSQSLGTEFDFDVAYKINRHQKLSVRYGDFNTSQSSAAERLPGLSRLYLNYSYDF